MLFELPGDVGTLDKQGRLQISSPDGGGDGGREVSHKLAAHPALHVNQYESVLIAISCAWQYYSYSQDNDMNKIIYNMYNNNIIMSM